MNHTDASSSIPESPCEAVDSPAATGKPRRTWLLAVQIVFTIGLISWLMTRIDLHPLVAVFGRIQWPFVGLVVCLSLLERMLTAWKWHVLMLAKRLTLSLWELFRIQMIANFLGSFLPSSVGVDAVRIYLVSRSTGRTLDCIAASAVDRLVMVLGYFMLAAGAVIAGAILTPRGPAYWSIPVAAAIAVAAVAILAKAEWMRRVGAVMRPVLGQRISRATEKFYWSLHAYHGQQRAIAAAFGLTAIMLALRILTVEAEARAFGVFPSFSGLFLTLPLVWIALMLPISIGNLGLQESAYLIALGAVGVDPASAVAISLLEQIVSRAISLPGAAFWLSGRRVRLSELQASAAVSSQA